MAGNQQHLDDSKSQGQAHQTKDLEVDPEVGAHLLVQAQPEVESNVQVEQSSGQEKKPPTEIHFLPDRAGQFQLSAQQVFEHGAPATDLAAEDDRCKQPIDDGWLPLDKCVVPKRQGQATENGNDQQGHYVSSFKTTMAKPMQANLQQRSRDGSSSRNVDAIDFVRCEKKNQRKKVKQ